MNKEQYIFNELGIKVANLTIEVATLKAQLNEAYEIINEYKKEGETTDENQND